MRTVAGVSRLAQETDPEILRKAVTLLESHNRALSKQIAMVLRELEKARAELAAIKGESVTKQLRLEALEQQLAKLTKQIFGASSEKRDVEPEPTTTPPEGDGAPKKKRSGHGPKQQPALPLIFVDHDLDEPDKICTQCGGCLEEMENQFEESDEIDVVPLRFVRKRHRRKKFACRCGACVETALGPDKLVPGGRYSVGFAVHVAIAKYCDHLPLERQVRMMARDGLEVTSQTLWDQIERLTSIVESVMPRLLAHVLGHAVVGADETTWELMGKKVGHGKSWFVWVLRVDTAVYYTIREGRSFAVAESLLAQFVGVLMCDGYSAYEKLSNMYPRVVLAHCWAHVRREFVDIEKSFPTACGEVLVLIGQLYAIEKKCRLEGLDLAKARDTESRAVVDRIVEWFYRTLPTCLPESGLHKAIGYMVHMWLGLVLFLDDPQIPLDNNGTERAARGPVVGRKNHHGSRSLRGTEVAAILYSLVESAKLIGLEPRFYLRVAVRAGLRSETVPLPHEVKARLADGSLDPTDYEDPADGIVLAALAAAHAAARAGPSPSTEAEVDIETGDTPP